mgnify:CR=1 FL=1
MLNIDKSFKKTAEVINKIEEEFNITNPNICIYCGKEMHFSRMKEYCDSYECFRINNWLNLLSKKRK